MSKYYKAEDVINLLATEYYTYKQAEIIEVEDCKAAATFNTRHLPTIEVSEDCISRAWLWKNYQTVCENVICSECPFDSDDCRLADFVMNAPSVVPSCQKNRQVERAEGEWINKQEKYQMAECSNCKKVTMHEMWGDKLVYYDYCPNCGAKMKG